MANRVIILMTLVLMGCANRQPLTKFLDVDLPHRVITDSLDVITLKKDNNGVFIEQSRIKHIWRGMISLSKLQVYSNGVVLRNDRIYRFEVAGKSFDVTGSSLSTIFGDYKSTRIVSGPGWCMCALSPFILELYSDIEQKNVIGGVYFKFNNDDEMGNVMEKKLFQLNE